MNSKISPTPYPDVNADLVRLLAAVRAALGPQLAGVYVHGSLATGDFYPPRSDVDFLVATVGELGSEWLPRLAEMHTRLAAAGGQWARKMEGPYISLSALRRYDPAHAVHPALRVDGTFAPDWHASDWIIQRWILREHAIVLHGPPPRTLIDPVTPDDLRRAARGILAEWWAPQLSDSHRLYSREYQAYAALTMCRSLYTLKTGEVTGKRRAARWAQARLDADQVELVERALAWPDGEQADELPAVLALIRLTLAAAGLPPGEV